jgi:tetratricopeptide (TPR) repeat protein
MARMKKSKKEHMDSDSVISRLVALIYRAHEAEMDFIAGLSDGERAAQGTYEDWAPKDLIAHTNYWRKRAIESLAYLSRGQNPPEYPDYMQVNRENFEENGGLPLQYQLRESKVILKALIDALNRFDDEDLTDPDRYPWRKGQPLIAYVISNAYIHPITHLCQNYLKLGDQVSAQKLQEAAVTEISEVDPGPASRNLAVYDLACLFAQTGELEKALKYLAEVLPQSRELADWSRQDSDLAALHDDPRYLALVKT